MVSKNEAAEKLEQVLEVPMILLALLIIPLVIIELELVPTNEHVVSLAIKMDDGIWFAFLLEYLVLVTLYDDKIGYTKRSWLILVILIVSPPGISPHGFALIRSLRFFRAFRSIRIVLALKRGITPLWEVLVKNYFYLVILITTLLIISFGIAFSWVEHRNISVQGIFQGIWWAFETVTTVGYGDIYPQTFWGRILAAVVMLVGIGFIAILTANIASYFVEKDEQKETEQRREKERKEDQNQEILERLEELSKKLDEIYRRLP
jgi:voltage-gated potassium channel